MFTGCPVKLFPLGYLLFCQLLLIQIAKVEIIEVKVGNHHLEIDILLLHRGKKKFYVKGGKATLTNFKIFVPIM